jgi:hypothetical protein
LLEGRESGGVRWAVGEADGRKGEASISFEGPMVRGAGREEGQKGRGV